MGYNRAIGDNATGPVSFDLDSRCTGKIKMVGYSINDPVGKVRYDITTVKLDTVQRNFQTKVLENREPLHRAYFEGSVVRLHLANCFTGSKEFHSFHIVKMR